MRHKFVCNTTVETPLCHHQSPQHLLPITAPSIHSHRRRRELEAAAEAAAARVRQLQAVQRAARTRAQEHAARVTDLRRQLQRAARELEAVRHEYGMPPPPAALAAGATAGAAAAAAGGSGGGEGGVRGPAVEGEDRGVEGVEGKQQQRQGVDREVARYEAAVVAARRELQQLLEERSRLGDCQVRLGGQWDGVPWERLG